MTKPAMKSLDSFEYMTQENGWRDHSGVVEIKTTKYGRVRLLVGGDATYLDPTEAQAFLEKFQRVCAGQWGVGWGSHE